MGRALVFLLAVLAAAGTGCVDAVNPLLDGSGPGASPIPARPGEGNLTVHFLDVGQGDAILLAFPAGAFVLVDAGPREAADAVTAALDAANVTTLWAFVASHGHADHLGSAPAVFDHVRVERVYDPGHPLTTRTYERFLDAVETEGSDYFTAEDFAPGDTLDVDANVTVTLLHPDAVNEDGDPNEEGIVLRVRYGEVAFLLTGDAGFSTESALADGPFDVQSTVLKVGHHGSRYSSGRTFLAAVQPEVAVVSVGDNEYGHPTYEALYRIEEAGATVHRTDEAGTVTVTTDGLAYDVHLSREAADP